MPTGPARGSLGTLSSGEPLSGIQVAVGEKMKVRLIEQEKNIEIQEKQAELTEKELTATLRKKAEADKYVVEQNALAKKSQEIAYAQAEAEKIKLAAEAEAQRIEKLGQAEAVVCKRTLTIKRMHWR